MYETEKKRDREREEESPGMREDVRRKGEGEKSDVNLTACGNHQWQYMYCGIYCVGGLKLLSTVVIIINCVCILCGWS